MLCAVGRSLGRGAPAVAEIPVASVAQRPATSAGGEVEQRDRAALGGRLERQDVVTLRRRRGRGDTAALAPRLAHAPLVGLDDLSGLHCPVARLSPRLADAAIARAPQPAGANLVGQALAATAAKRVDLRRGPAGHLAAPGAATAASCARWAAALGRRPVRRQGPALGPVEADRGQRRERRERGRGGCVANHAATRWSAATTATVLRVMSRGLIWSPSGSVPNGPATISVSRWTRGP